MSIRRVVKRAEGEAIIANADKNMKFLNEIVQTLKANPGDFVEIDEADMNRLINKINYMKRTGGPNEDYRHLKITKVTTNSAESVALVEWLEKIV